MSSPYVVLENRPLDQWKVTELKEELKRRKLMTKGLKDDLVKRLDEAVRAELEQANQTHDNGVNDIHHPEDATVEPIVSVKTIMDDNSPKNESLEKDNMSEKLDINESLEKDNMADNLDNENRDRVHVDDGLQSLDTKLVTKGEHGTEGFQLIEEVSVKTCITVSELMVSEEVAQQDLQKVEINKQPDDEVSQVKSDSISIDNMSVIQKIELKDDVIADDDVKLEVDVKPEVSLSKVVLDDGKTESVIVDEPHEEKVTIEEKDVNIGESINILKRNDSGSPEKLNLDRSSGDDDIMEEDVLDGKQVDSIGDWSEKNEGSLVKEDVVVEDTSAAKNTQSTKDQTDPAVGSTKRKLHDQEAVSNNEAVKRQRRWNSQQQTNNSSSVSKHTFQVSMKHSFSRSDSSVSLEEPKEHVVPPSSKPPTTSLRIDRFLRPFTLKAVQQLLGKTGTVVSFWMDHIKTHCYVTYSSVEEAVETRNAVYNLQWPANGGRLLIAEFVDPSEVKSKTEAPLPSPVTPVSTTTTTTPQPLEAATKPPPAPQQQLPPPPPLPLPSPPPLSHHPPQSREAALPPPPLLPEKVDPQIVTLDDLFRKTRATPRIYYLPLSEEQVAAKLNKTAKQ